MNKIIEIENQAIRVSFTIIEKNPVHIGFRVHVNGGLAGNLVLRVEEFEEFRKLVKPFKIYE